MIGETGYCFQGCRKQFWVTIALFVNDRPLYVGQEQISNMDLRHFIPAMPSVSILTIIVHGNALPKGSVRNMSAVNSPSNGDGGSYFLTAHRRVASEPDSPSISPSNHPASAPARPIRRPRPPVRSHPRPGSDDLSGYSRFTVQTIHENEASQNRAPLSSIETPPHKSSRASAVTPSSDGGDLAQQRAPRSIATSQRTSSSYVSVKSIARRCMHRFNSTSPRHNATPVPNARSRPVHRRARSESGASRAKPPTILPRRKTRSVENSARRRFRNSSESYGSIPTPTVALRPPISSSVSEHGLVDRHEIKLETPFSPLPKDLSEVRLRKEPPSSRRLSAIHARAIFTAPLNLVRRFRKLSNTRPALPVQKSSSPSISDTHGRMLGHISQLRREKTHEALRQVSQLLRLISGDKADGLAVEPRPINMKTMSTKSTPPVKELKEGRKLERKQTQDVPPAPVRIATQKSMELEERNSDSSSIRNLRLGPPPNATPDPHATYKVKRSPSVETEEFLKVDISVRGGTSYLPSEARRIHTPPLPGEGAGGKRRGFFFDYNAPRHLSIDDAKAQTRGSAEEKSAVVGESGMDRVQVSWRDVSSVSGRIVPSTDPGSHPALCTGAKRRPIEWFDTQLAELDTFIDDDTSFKVQSKYDSPSRGFSELRERTAQALHDMRTRNVKLDDLEEEGPDHAPGLPGNGEDEEDEEEEEIDHSVPEHYPTSPLCPANVEYWRLVDGKLGQGRRTRTCWMHGDSKV